MIYHLDKELDFCLTTHSFNEFICKTYIDTQCQALPLHWSLIYINRQHLHAHSPSTWRKKCRSMQMNT